MTKQEQFERETGESAIESFKFESKSVAAFEAIGHYEIARYNNKYVKWLEKQLGE